MKKVAMEPQSVNINVLAYNTHLFGGIFFAEMGLQFHKDEERREAIVNFLNESSYDIVGLCEVWSDSYKNYIIQNTTKTFPYSSFKSKKLTEFMGSGLLILSRFPIVAKDFLPFKTLTGVDSLTHKGVVINFLGKKVRVFLTHAQAQNDKVSCSSLIIRDQINQFVDCFRIDVLPTIIMGDLNTLFTRSDDNEYQSMISLFEGFQSGVSDEFVPTIDPNNNNLAKKFECDKVQVADFILFKNLTLNESKVLKGLKVGEDDCSDHYPVSSSFSLG